jgi:hypothetical protein
MVECKSDERNFNTFTFVVALQSWLLGAGGGGCHLY